MVDGKQVQAITPLKVINNIRKAIPGVVLDIFNKAIQDSFRDRRAVVAQEDVVSAIADTLGIHRGVVFERGYMDIEYHYELAGWDVKYVRKAIGDTHQPHYIFSVKL